MKKWLFGLLLLPIIVSCLGVAYASDTNCWEGKGTVPTTTYASGIVYGCDGEIPIITIYGDNGNGKSFGITIKAMNEGTGTVTIGSLNDTGAYGSLYQRGNNYPFPNVTQGEIIDVSFSKVDASSYAPGTYNSGIWILSNYFEDYRDSSDNRNLWGGSGDEKNLNGFWGYDTFTFEVKNVADRQGMCLEGYHMPSEGEWSALLYLWGKNYDANQGTSLFNSWNLSSLNYKELLNGEGNRFSEDMQIPFVGYRDYDGDVHAGNFGNYQSSSPSDSDIYARYFRISPNFFYADRGETRGYGHAVRCFKNSYVKPSYSLTFDSQGGSEVDTGIAEENTSWTKPDDPTKSGYIFVDWYTSTGYETAFDFTTLATGDLTVYAKWGCETGYKDNGTECVLNKDIVIEATSTAANQTLKINKYFANAYTVDWGDGSPIETVSADKTHTYTGTGTYTIILSPATDRWTFQKVSKPLVSTNGTTMTGVRIIYMPSLADGFGNTSEAPGDNFFNAFNRDGKIISLPAGSFDTSNIINVGRNFFYSFNQNGDIADLPAGSFRFSTGLTAAGDCFFTAFNLGGKITSLPEGSFDTSYITIAPNGFFRVFNLQGELGELPAKSFNISNISFVGDHFFEQFNHLGALTYLPEGSFRLSTSLTEVGGSFFALFNRDGQLTSLPEGSFDTSNITRAAGGFFTLFNNGGALTNLPDSFTLNSVGISNNGYPNAFNSPNYALNKKVSDLVSGFAIPSLDIDTFSDNQPGRCGVHENWLVTTADACSISYDDGLGGTGEFKYTADTTGVVAGSGMVEPEKVGYIFSGWIDASGNRLDEVVFPDMDGETLYANWMPNEYVIVFVDGSGDNESVIYSGKYNLAVEVQYPNWTKEGYTIHWDKEIPATMPLNGDTITASWTENKKPSGGSSGGGGRSSSKDVISNDSEKSSEQPAGNQVDSSEQAPHNNNSNTQDSSANASEGQNQQQFTQEFKEAYEFAKGKGITTMPTIQKADMDGKLTRIAMAKMLSQYAMNVLGQKPANIVTPKFKDVTDKQNSDYDDGVTLAYQLGIMGQNMPNNNFRPNDEVTRAEFATALSRMVYHTSDGEYKSTPKYYIHHMEKLVKEGIITKDDPEMKELRGYVMIMLMRSAK